MGAAGLLHPHPDEVAAVLFAGPNRFFLAADKVQVKYEMLRAHGVDGVSVTEAAEFHGYSRAAFYLVATSFEERGMAGLVDERRGRRGPVKLTPQVVAFLRGAEVATPELVAEVERRFGMRLHRRTVERARRV
ncbi:MAG: helix-turn-helix domain containing protein [Acidobacteria bacterium]|nr:helix-turn-helix domain containing protein [Acidobacteriota bacterium]